MLPRYQRPRRLAHAKETCLRQSVAGSFLALLVVAAFTSAAFAQSVGTDGGAATLGYGHEDLHRSAEVGSLLSVAEMAIKASERTQTFVLWILAFLVGGGVVGIWTMGAKVRGFVGRLKSEVEESLESMNCSVNALDQVLRFLPLVLAPEVDLKSRQIALQTLAQMKRSELAPVFANVLRLDRTPEIKADAAYALRMLGPGCEEWIPELLAASVNEDARIRRECAGALAASGRPRADVERRLQEMKHDLDPSVREIAGAGLASLRLSRPGEVPEQQREARR